MATRAKTWGDFKRWCDARKLKALPAHPWTIAAYLRWLERRKQPQAVRPTLDIIAREHVLKTARVPTRHPTVQRTLDAIERRANTAGQRSSLFDEEDLLPGVEAKKPRRRKVQKDESGEPSRRWPLSSTPRLKSRRPK